MQDIKISDKEYIEQQYAAGIYYQGKKNLEANKNSFDAAWFKLENESKSPATPDAISDLLKQFGAHSTVIDDLLEDYRFYVSTGEQRRPNVWAGLFN